MIKTKQQSFIVIGVFALVLMLFTTTYAFFNYTRTGVANTIRTGRISFNTSQSNTLNLTNVFPMSATDAGNANLDAVSVRIWGDTTYVDGEEYEISIVDVNNTIGSGASVKTIPINYIASYSATPVQSGDPNVIGTNSDSYFTARGQSSPVYQLSGTGEATNGEQVLIGFIPSGATGIDGTLTIKAYLDSSKIAISDTYPAEETDTNSDGYIDGTPTSFGEGKTVLTTEEWNSLQNTQTPLSFKIKAVSNEGTWVEAPLTTATLDTGIVVRSKLTMIVEAALNESTLTPYNNSNLTDVFIHSVNFIKASAEPNKSNFVNTNIISSPNSDLEIYAWGEKNEYEVNIYFWTQVNEIYLNEDSSYLFRKIGVGYDTDAAPLFSLLNTSKVKNMSHMFDDCILDFTLIQNWDVSSVLDMSYMFKGCFNFDSAYIGTSFNDASPLNNWDIENVNNFDGMFTMSKSDYEYYFEEDPAFVLPTFSKRPGTWTNEIVQMTTYIQSPSYSITYVPNN